MKPPIFGQRLWGTEPQQYLQLARMYRDAALFLPNYVGPNLNWPAYFLLMHACELTLKAFCKQCVANGQPYTRAPNHDLTKWYAIALNYGLPPADAYTKEALDTLSVLHDDDFARYPDNRRGPIPEVSDIANIVVEWLLAVVSPVVQQG
jgi:hypothetical protein